MRNTEESLTFHKYLYWFRYRNQFTISWPFRFNGNFFSEIEQSDFELGKTSSEFFSEVGISLKLKDPTKLQQEISYHPESEDILHCHFTKIVFSIEFRIHPTTPCGEEIFRKASQHQFILLGRAEPNPVFLLLHF